MKIAVYGGAFDPPHLGHIRLVNSICGALNPDKVVIIPTGNAPHKSSLTSYEHRFAMAKLAFPDYEISDIEQSSRISYTVETLRELHRLYPLCDFFLIVGGDSLADFHKWYKHEQILDLCTVIVGGRDGISSTLIRDRTTHNEKIGDIVPTKVCDYIKQKGLYK